MGWAEALGGFWGFCPSAKADGNIKFDGTSADGDVIFDADDLTDIGHFFLFYVRFGEWLAVEVLEAGVVAYEFGEEAFHDPH